jgi:hypothetical protein
MGRALAAAVGLSLCLHALVEAQQAASNINVLPVVVNPADPNAYLKGDLYLQRQVEPSIAASTRNPQTLLAFFNDYRAVDIAGDIGMGETENGAGALAWLSPIRKAVAWAFRRPPARARVAAPAAAAEAWVGFTRSYDGGLTWSGAFLPGALFDSSPASLASPVYGLEAATDPVVSAAPCGRFYVVFLAFTRGGQSKMAVARFEDRNNVEGGDGVRYDGTTVIETGNNATHGYFLDKPFLLVDPSRTGSADPCAHNVYVSYTTFNGLEKDGKFKSKVTFARSTNGGASFTTTKLNMPFNQNQGTALGVDPRAGTPATTGGGTVYLIWRHFIAPDTMLVHKSTDYGATFRGSPVQITAGAPLADLQKFDQPTQTTATHPPSQLTFRSNAFPTLTVSATGAVFAAWQERVDIAPNSLTFGMPAPNGSPRIVLMRSTDGGSTWTDRSGTPGMRRAVDFADRDVVAPAAGEGYLPQLRPSGPQVMPRLIFGGGRLMLVYYESRGFVRQFPFEQIQLADITDNYIAGIDRMLDMRAALLDPGTGGLVGSAQVSRYPIKPWANLTDGEGLDDVMPVNAPCAPDFPAADGATLPPCVRRVSRSNLPQSGSGTAPFIGDYADATAAVQFVPNDTGTGWRWATDPADVPHPGFHVVFADNRNLIPPTLPADVQDWERYRFYAPPGIGGSCLNAGSRNTDILTSRVNGNVVVSAATTYKQLGTIQRAFPVTVANPTRDMRFYRVTFATPQMGGVASFSQTDEAVDQADIQVFPASSVTLVTYVEPDAPGAVTVLVQEIDALDGTVVSPGASGRATFNADGSNPLVTNGTIDTTETHESSVGAPLYQNPFYQNPLYQNPLYQNPLYQNPLYQNSTIYDVQQVTWSVQNAGNTASSYLALVHIDNAAAYTNDYVFLLTVSKAASVGVLQGCDSANLAHEQIISSTILNPLYQNPLYQNPLYQNPLYQNPLYQNPLYQNATFSVAPADGATGGGSHDGTTHAKKTPDSVQVTLTAFRISENPVLVFDPDVSPPSVAVHAQSLNNVNGELIEPPPAFLGSDLVFASAPPSATPAVVQAGGQVSFPSGSWTLKNTGNTIATPVAGEIQNAIYLSTDATITKDDLLLGFATTAPLAPGEERILPPVVATIPPGTPAGQYYIGLYLDEPLAVSELSEVNNTVSALITVAAPNSAPVAASQSVSTAEDTAASITLGATDANDDPLTFVIVSAPAHGTLSGTGPALTYTPGANFNGADSFTFRVNDGSVDSELATVSITVTSVNDAPVASDGALAVVEDAPAAGTLAAADVEGDALTYSLVSQAAKGTVAIVNALSGAFTYTPQPNAYGADSFTFRASDGAALSAVATVHVAIAPQNDGPAAAGQVVAAVEDTPRAITLTASDVDGDTLVFTILQPPASGVLSGSGPSLVYTPALNFNGADAFTYSVSDGALVSGPAIVSISVAPVNDAPVAAPDTASVLQNAGSVTVPVLANDTDVDGNPLAVTGVTQAPGGTVTFTASSVTFAPALNFAGPSTFSYTVSDGSGGTAVGSVTVTVQDDVADYGFIGLQSPWKATPAYSVKVGSAAPLVWQYTNASGLVVPSSIALPEVRIKGPFACQSGETQSTVEVVAYPGNSGFQYFTNTNTWQFNWQTTGLAVGCYNVRIFSEQTRQINGPFLVRLVK